MVAKRVKKYLPASDKVSQHKMLRWLGPTLTKPSLWQINRRSIAMGLAIGVFWGFLIPVAQIVFAAIMAVFLRANLPMAIGSTLVTNPVTFAPVYFLAYQFGDFVLGKSGPDVTEEMLAAQMGQISVTSAGWIDRIGDVAAPLFTGLVVFASVGAVLSYVVVSLLWRLAVVLRYRKRL
ncbi:MAG TPA: DUF2062 domain-containing protein, partial [Orrella sp.]